MCHTNYQAWKKCLFPCKQVKISFQFDQIPLQNDVFPICISFSPKIFSQELPDLPIFSKPANY